MNTIPQNIKLSKILLKEYLDQEKIKTSFILGIFFLIPILASTLFAQEFSTNVYRIPYANGTSVRVNRDHTNHNPLGRLDLEGRSLDRPYKIVAAAAGTIRFIEDDHDQRLVTGSVSTCHNNYVWIEHKNGEWTKYTHLQKNSVTQVARLRVNQFVTAGRFLGYEGEVGCASGPHLHFEVGVPSTNSPLINADSGTLLDNANSNRNRIPRICGIPDKTFKRDQIYKARKVPRALAEGLGEIIQIGVAPEDLDCLIEQASISGYRPIWIDADDTAGTNFFNVIFRPQRGGTDWIAHHDLRSRELDQKTLEHKRMGYKVIHLESYKTNTAVKYAAIFLKRPGETTITLNKVKNDYQKDLVDYKKLGWQPKAVSVVSIGGIRRYATLFERSNASRQIVRSRLTFSEYQRLNTENTEKGFQIAYINSYLHKRGAFAKKGDLYFSVIWSSKNRPEQEELDKLTRRTYLRETGKFRRSGFLIRFITGYSNAGSTNYSVIWEK